MDEDESAVNDGWRPPRRYKNQLIVMATDEMANAVRHLARYRGSPRSEVLRDLIERGLGTLHHDEANLLALSVVMASKS